MSDGGSSGSSDDDGGWKVLSIGAKRPAAITKPRDDWTWQDHAITDCFQLAVDSHKTNNAAQASEWKPPQQQHVWTPEPIPLPSWAVDPMLIEKTT